MRKATTNSESRVTEDLFNSYMEINERQHVRKDVGWQLSDRQTYACLLAGWLFHRCAYVDVTLYKNNYCVCKN